MANYPKKYEEKCVTCRNYDTSPLERGYQIWLDDKLKYGFECRQRSGRYRLDDSCSYYDENRYIDERDIDKIIDFLDRYTSYRFYVLSTICEILGISFDTSAMKAFKILREASFEYPKGLDNLKAYDYFGVQISDALINKYSDPNTKEELITYLQNVIIPRYVQPFTKMVLGYKNYPAALKIYTKMIKTLAGQYGIILDIKNIPDVSRENLGFSNKRTLKGMI